MTTSEPKPGKSRRRRKGTAASLVVAVSCGRALPHPNYSNNVTAPAVMGANVQVPRLCTRRALSPPCSTSLDACNNPLRWGVRRFPSHKGGNEAQRSIKVER